MMILWMYVPAFHCSVMIFQSNKLLPFNEAGTGKRNFCHMKPFMFSFDQCQDQRTWETELYDFIRLAPCAVIWHIQYVKAAVMTLSL
jgi:hypothetical protein